MGCKIEPAIWSRDTGHRRPCFDSCQLTHSSIDPNMGLQHTIFINGGRTVEVWTEYMITRQVRRGYELVVVSKYKCVAVSSLSAA